MPVLEIVVHHRSYHVACGEGQEDHVRALASMLDRRMEKMAAQMGKASDSMLLLMSALMLEDELAESRQQLERLQNGTVEALDVVGAEKLADISLEAEKKAVAQANVALAKAIDGVSEYLEGVAGKISEVESA